MSENPNSDDQPDNDPTDELPVLSEAAMAALDAEVPTLADAVTTETGEHTARLFGPRMSGPRLSLGTDDEARGPSVAALERDIAALTARWGGLEAHLDRNVTAIATLGEQLAATQQALDSSNAAQRQLIEQLRERESGLDELKRSLDDSDVARRDLLADLGRKDEQIEQLQAALERSAEELRTVHEAQALKAQRDDAALDGFAQDLADAEARRAAAETARADLQAELAARNADLGEARAGAEARESQTASLAAELDRRAAEIDELRGRLLAQSKRLETLEPAAARADALESELERERQARLAAKEAPESADVDEYRAEIASLSTYIENRRREWDDLHAALAEHKTRISELERELAQRADRQMQLEATVHDETERSNALRTELAALKTRVADEAAALAKQRSAAAPPDAARTADADRVRTLEARVAELEQTLSAQQETLDARQRELAAADQARSELEAQLADRDGNPIAGPELVDPALPVEVQSQRLTTLQRELSERIDALRELQDEMSSGEVVDFDARRSEDKAAAAGNRFSLVCLTSDEPEAYDIDRAAMTIGRSSECDIQILTHFVSREHARLDRDGDSVLIEDLGSTNGVFVNAVRVERQPLQHGDWVTIGETQFRFLDRRAT